MRMRRYKVRKLIYWMLLITTVLPVIFGVIFMSNHSDFDKSSELFSRLKHREQALGTVLDELQLRSDQKNTSQNLRQSQSTRFRRRLQNDVMHPTLVRLRQRFDYVPSSAVEHITTNPVMSTSSDFYKRFFKKKSNDYKADSVLYRDPDSHIIKLRPADSVLYSKPESPIIKLSPADSVLYSKPDSPIIKLSPVVRQRIRIINTQNIENNNLDYRSNGKVNIVHNANNVRYDAKQQKTHVYTAHVNNTGTYEYNSKIPIKMRTKSNEHDNMAIKISNQIEPLGRGKKNKKIGHGDLDGYKKILYWNDVYGHDDFHFGFGKKGFRRFHCPVDKCFATNNRTLFDLSQVDAVLWNLGASDRTLPPVRSPHTMYIMYMLESPHFSKFQLTPYNGVFNWTFTYRKDSDFYIPYGVMEPMEPSDIVSLPSYDYAAGKTKMAAWFVSHCNTRGDRARYVKTLQEHISVDVYGDCGPNDCDKKNFSICGEMVRQHYKFYLAFENSVCKDYFTEKLFRMMNYDVIPIVYGKGYELNGLPPLSYINVFDFESVEVLANYLIYLSGNDTAYNEYFSWKGNYKIIPTWQHNGRSFCSICEQLHKIYPETIKEDGKDNMKLNVLQKEMVNKSEKYHKVYENIHKWWIIDAECLTPNNNEQFHQYIRGMSKTQIREANIPGHELVPSIAHRPNIKRQ